MAKDLVFVAIGFFLLWKGGFFMSVLGIFALVWYGRDAYYQAKALWQEKNYKAPGSTADAFRPSQTPPQNGKITLSSDAKEAEYTKE